LKVHRIPLARALVHLNLRVRKGDIRFAVGANIPQVLVVFNISLSLLIDLIRLKRKELFNKVLIRSSQENSQKEKRRAIDNYFLIYLK
jgi:hypothetical protein